MSKARLRSDKILSKKIDLLKIETDGRLKNEQVQKITDEISNLRNEAAGNEKLTQRLDTLEKNLNQKIKKPASKIRTNQVAVAPAPENHASPALTKAFLRYSKLAKQTPVKRMAKYKTENFTAENDLAMVKLAESSLTEIETLLDKYSKALNSFCNRKMKNSKPGTKPLNEDVEYSTAKNLSEQLRQIKTEIQEAGPLTKKMAAVKKISEHFTLSIEEFTQKKSKENVHLHQASGFFSPPNLVKIFINYLDKDRHCIDDKLRHLSNLQYKR